MATKLQSSVIVVGLRLLLLLFFISAMPSLVSATSGKKSGHQYTGAGRGYGFRMPNFGFPPGFGGGYGFGYGGPGGGYGRSGTYRTSVVCRDKGPCYEKTLACPAKCFNSYSSHGRNYGAGGGGGGCTIDCKKCIAYC